jgi:hypothetical protein
MPGYSVEVLSLTSLRYVEADRSVLVPAAMAGPADLVVYAANLQHWEAPDDHQPLADQDRRRIIQNLQSAFDFKGWEVRISWPFGERAPDGTWRWSTEGNSITDTQDHPRA